MRSVSLGLWFSVGSRDESVDQWGCSHFLEHTLFKGTPTRTALQIAEQLDGVGGEANAFTSREATCFYARVLDDALPIAMDVLADLVTSGSNDPADVDAERQVVLEELSILHDTPDDLAHGDLAALLLDGHPLGRETLGDPDSISTMTRDTIHDYYLAHYRPGNLVVVAAGNVDHEALERLVDDRLGDLGRPGGATAVRRSAPDGLSTGVVRVRHRPTEQAHVVVGGAGVPFGHPLRPALRVASTLLGGGMSSRLFQQIREVRGLAYSTYAWADVYSDVGLTGAYVGTTPTKVDLACRVMIDEIERLAGDLGDDEVERTIASLIGAVVLALEDTGSRMTRLGQLACAGQDLYGVDEAVARIERVTADEVRQVAADVLAAPRSVAVVGPFDEDPDRFAAYAGPGGRP
jgi:predicted Zn-dependent peptidase